MTLDLIREHQEFVGAIHVDLGTPVYKGPSVRASCPGPYIRPLRGEEIEGEVIWLKPTFAFLFWYCFENIDLDQNTNLYCVQFS